MPRNHGGGGRMHHFPSSGGRRIRGQSHAGGHRFRLGIHHIRGHESSSPDGGSVKGSSHREAFSSSDGDWGSYVLTKLRSHQSQFRKTLPHVVRETMVVHGWNTSGLGHP